MKQICLPPPHNNNKKKQTLNNTGDLIPQESAISTAQSLVPLGFPFISIFFIEENKTF